MAKGKERDTSKLLDKKPPEQGGEEMKGGRNFLNMKEGDEFTGILVGSTQIESTRGKKKEMVTRYVLQRGNDTLISPSHFDLDSKLEAILAKGSMRRVWIFFRGFELNVPGVQGGKLARYTVVDYGEKGAK